MRFEVGISLVLTIGLIAGQTAAQTPSSPPIFQPGAPGQPSRIVTPAQALELGRTRFTQADVRFMQHMIVHHAQAVEMVGLLETRGSDQRVKLLGRRIALSQEAEMAIMRTWLEERGQSTEMQMDHAAMGHAGMDHSTMNHSAMGHGEPATRPDDTPVMAGMLTPRQMRTLAAASGAEFDRLFLTGMIQHHQGALDMVAALMETPDAAEDTMLSDFTTSVVADQQAEILRMRSLLSDH
ncbi:DUF305 domain-containing protein [Brevundimonas sp. NIBR11]|uniref:DUF305 domain-containing protein n=1 Tax=Brevundimonas sp. NIBR11 TaxID=3015999 RepID=UPI0022F08A58|nr:DUF305 domain-containing protein [Brevundimonas sp. NIBR11]WGM32198.1 hypothetical protein KKHFBJBL_02449 [Brevundimonas sp. NIBR11]